MELQRTPYSIFTIGIITLAQGCVYSLLFLPSYPQQLHGNLADAKSSHVMGIDIDENNFDWRPGTADCGTITDDYEHPKTH